MIKILERKDGTWIGRINGIIGFRVEAPTRAEAERLLDRETSFGSNDEKSTSNRDNGLS